MSILRCLFFHICDSLQKNDVMRVTDFGQSRRPETGKAVTGPMDGAAVINNKKDALLWG